MARLRIGGTGNFNFNNNQLYIDNTSGKVGIGDSLPLVKLSVNGNTSFGSVNCWGNIKCHGIFSGDFYNSSNPIV